MTYESGEAALAAMARQTGQQQDCGESAGAWRWMGRCIYHGQRPRPRPRCQCMYIHTNLQQQMEAGRRQAESDRPVPVRIGARVPACGAPGPVNVVSLPPTCCWVGGHSCTGWVHCPLSTAAKLALGAASWRRHPKRLSQPGASPKNDVLLQNSLASFTQALPPHHLPASAPPLIHHISISALYTSPPSSAAAKRPRPPSPAAHLPSPALCLTYPRPTRLPATSHARSSPKPPRIHAGLLMQPP